MTRMAAMLAVAIVLSASAVDARRDGQEQARRMCGRVIQTSCKSASDPLVIEIRADRGRDFQLTIAPELREAFGSRVEDRYAGRAVCVNARVVKGTKVVVESLSDIEITAQPKVPRPSLPPGVFELCDPGITPPTVEHAVHARYPTDAMKERIQGMLGMRVVVGADGTVADVNVIEPLAPALDRAAVMAMKAWRFVPGKREGAAVPVAVYIEMSFQLR